MVHSPGQKGRHCISWGLVLFPARNPQRRSWKACQASTDQSGGFHK